MQCLRGHRTALILIVGLVSTAHGQAPAPPRVPPAAAAKAQKQKQLDAILREWEQRSAERATINAQFNRRDVSKVWGNTEYQGQASLQRPDLARLEMRKVDREKNPPVFVPHEEIICTGKHVLQYMHETRQIFVFPLAKEERQRALDEGPLPFLFNTRADDLKRRYDLSLRDENKTVYLLAVTPLLAADQDSCSKAFIWLNRATLLPDKLMLVAPNEQDTREYTFTVIRENEKLDPDKFVGRKPRGWTVVQNPAAPQAPAPNRAGAPAPGRVRQ